MSCTILFQAHALVSSQGVCSRAILTAAGPQLENTLKTYQVQQPGKIIATPGYLLACDHVIHTRCTNWNGVRGNGEAVSTVDNQEYYNSER